MKRAAIILTVLVMMCPFTVCAESFIDVINTSLNDTVLSAAIGDRLIIVGDYDLMNNAADGNVSDIISQHTEELAQYSSVVMLFTKDGTIYLGMEFPLSGGAFTEGTESLLMSPSFLQQNLSIGK